MPAFGFGEPRLFAFDVDLPQDRRVQRCRRRLATRAHPIFLRGHLLDHRTGRHRFARFCQNLEGGVEGAHSAGGFGLRGFWRGFGLCRFLGGLGLLSLGVNRGLGFALTHRDPFIVFGLCQFSGEIVEVVTFCRLGPIRFQRGGVERDRLGVERNSQFALVLEPPVGHFNQIFVLGFVDLAFLDDRDLRFGRGCGFGLFLRHGSVPFVASSGTVRSGDLRLESVVADPINVGHQLPRVPKHIHSIPQGFEMILKGFRKWWKPPEKLSTNSMSMRLKKRREFKNLVGMALIVVARLGIKIPTPFFEESAVTIVNLWLTAGAFLAFIVLGKRWLNAIEAKERQSNSDCRPREPSDQPRRSRVSVEIRPRPKPQIDGAVVTSDPKELPYKLKPSILTKSEHHFFKNLLKICRKRAVVCVMVRLSDIVDIPRNRSVSGRHAFGRLINGQHIDFLICERGTMRPLVGIELNGREHNRPQRQRLDQFKQSVCTAAGFALIWQPKQTSYNCEELNRKLSYWIPAAK